MLRKTLATTRANQGKLISDLEASHASEITLFQNKFAEAEEKIRKLELQRSTNEHKYLKSVGKDQSEMLGYSASEIE